MPPIRSHESEVDTDRPWDAAEATRNARSGEDAAYYGRVFAWRDPDGDPATLAAYKFPHHFVGAEGQPGAASARGCQSGIGVLNGAMGGADIPSEDRQGVYNHLAAHLEAAEIEPAELRAHPWPAINPAGVERRALAPVEVRIGHEEDGRRRIEAYAALFDSVSEDLGGFREVIHPGAFTRTIQEADIRGLQNHDPNYVLGRSRSGTLVLNEDDRGLRFVAWPPDTAWARDLLTTMERGDIDQCSFSFQAVRDRLEITADQTALRHLLEVRLYDVSVVTFPAYPETTAEVRARVLEFQTHEAGRGAGPGGGAQTTVKPGARRSVAVARLELARRGHP